MKILVLYEELALYLINGFNVLAGGHDCQILIISKKINAVAPFRFNSVNSNITIKERESFSDEKLLQLCREFNPDFVFLGGWVHKPYLKIIKSLRKKTVLAFDNQWNGSMRQALGCLYFKIILKRFIARAFVAGDKQADFALRLGFKDKEITKGLYCCDYDLYAPFAKLKTEAGASISKRFLYVGRYAKEKNIENLWTAFIQLQKEKPNEWELWCLGKGDVAPVQHPKVKHFGFMQPDELSDIIANTGVFVLPSYFEPWGVVVHEYTAAGFPVLCSDKVGAIDLFVRNNVNGFIFNAENSEQLKDKLNKFTEMPEAGLKAMAQKSAELASQLTPQIWAEKLMDIIKL